MNVSAVIVTRGNVDLTEILVSLPYEWEHLVWDNGAQKLRRLWIPGWAEPGDSAHPFVEVPDLAVYGRYAAIEYAHGELIYVQDDDCVISQPEVLLTEWEEVHTERNESEASGRRANDHIVANMPAAFRHDFYRQHCLVGFGAVFHRNAPQRAFGHLRRANLRHIFGPDDPTQLPTFRRTCDVVFTALSPRVLFDVPYRNLPWATSDDRMYHQPQHVGERKRMLELALGVRDE